MKTRKTLNPFLILMITMILILSSFTYQKESVNSPDKPIWVYIGTYTQKNRM
ncbi:MAG: hypothetical protein HC830_08400 [Bacteroidetes bacterium]|nr:hypothetical protein [Bacteroidota bacterium]